MRTRVQASSPRGGPDWGRRYAGQLAGSSSIARLLGLLGIAWLAVSPLARAGPPDEAAPVQPQGERDDASDTRGDATHDSLGAGEAGETSELAPADGATDALAPAEGEAPPPSTAAEWYARGIELGAAGDYEAAARAFLRSYELVPTAEALFNAAYAYEQAGELVLAIDSYERFLAEAGAIDDSLRDQIEQTLAQLRRQVVIIKQLRIDPNRPLAELRVNGSRVELDELPLVVPPGAVEIEVIDRRGRRGSERYEVAAGEVLVVDVRALLPPEPELVTPTGDGSTLTPRADGPGPSDAVRRRRLSRLEVASYTGVAATVAAGATMATLGGLTLRARQRYDDATCLEFPGGVCPDGFQGDGSAARHLRNIERFSLGTNVMIGVTAGLAAGTLVVGLITLRARRRLDEGPGARVRLRPAPAGLRLEF